jgi:trehalose 6-phosphate phosphatase
MEHLLSDWPELRERLEEAHSILLLSDYDGTLTPIVERPEIADMEEDSRQLLRELSLSPRIKVGIVSGRSLIDLKSRIPIPGMVYVGNHGFEIASPEFHFVNPLAREIKPLLGIIHQTLSRAASTMRGVLVEDKGLTLSVHYRQAEEEHIPQIHNTLESVVNRIPLRGLFRITHGKKVYEVRPAIDWDKGKAIRLLMKRYGKGGRRSGLLPIYLGDDLTDEDGFKIIEKYENGITVHVGGPNPNSTARYYLNNPNEVFVFLEMLLESTREDLVCEQFATS